MKIYIEAQRIFEQKRSLSRYREILQELERAVCNVIDASTDFEMDSNGNYTISFDSSDPKFDAAYEELIALEKSARKEYRDIQFCTPGIYLVSTKTKADVSGN